MSAINDAIVRCFGRAVTIVLTSGHSIAAVPTRLDGEIVFLADGGFLSVADIRSCFLFLDTSPQVTNSSAATVERPAPATEQPSLPLTAVAAPSTHLGPTHVSDALRRTALPFTRAVDEYAWAARGVPPLRSRAFPSVDLSVTKRKRANTLWSRAVDYLSNRNWSKAREQLVECAAIVPAVEPIWGAAYAAVQEGNPVEALVLLQSRGHLITAEPELVRAMISLALQLQFLHTALRQLQSYAASQPALHDDFILLCCQNGLYRQAAKLLEEDPRAGEQHGEALLAYLLAHVTDDQPASAVERPEDGRISPEGVMPTLLLHARDRPSSQYLEAAARESALAADVDRLKESLRDREDGEVETDTLSPYVALIENNLRIGDLKEAMYHAIQALGNSRSKFWKERFRDYIGKIRQAQPAAVVSRRLPPVRPPSVGPALAREAAPPLAAADMPLWKQAAQAAQNNHLNRAVDLYQRFLDEEVEGRWSDRADAALNGLAMIYQQQSDRQKAIDTMLRYQKYVQAPLRFHNQLATLYYLVQQFDKATHHFSTAAALASTELERQRAQRNAQNARLRAADGAPLSAAGLHETDPYAVELSREHWGIDLNAPLRIQAVTNDLDEFLKHDIMRLVKDGTELVGVERARIAKKEFDYQTVHNLIRFAGDVRMKQGLRSQYLASALYVIYEQRWHLDADAEAQKLDPIRFQTQLAAALGDDAAGQNRYAVAREYFACLLERNPNFNQALAKVRDFIGTFTLEIFEKNPDRKHSPDRFNELLENRAPDAQVARAQAVWGILHLAGLSTPANRAVHQILEPSHRSLQFALRDLFPKMNLKDMPFADTLRAGTQLVESQHQRIHDQFQVFRNPEANVKELAGPLGEAFRELAIQLPYNPLDFGSDGRIVQWRRSLLPQVISYLNAASTGEKETRYQGARSAIELARRDIMDHPSRFGRRVLLPILERWATSLQDHFDAWEQTVTPSLDVRCEAAVFDPKSGGYKVDLLVTNARGSSTALEVHIDLDVPGWEATPYKDTEPRSLEGGQSEPQLWILRQDAGQDLVGTATARLTFLDRRGRPRTQNVSFDVIQPVPFADIANPYDPGPPVQTDWMLKGRQEQVAKLVRGVSDIVRCSFFRVIGARRVGKSSIVEAVIRQLRQDPRLLVTDRLDVRKIGSRASISDVLQVWSDALCKEARKTARALPEWHRSNLRPATEDFLTWIEEQVRSVGHPVLLLDEFQGIADMFDDVTLRDFLNFWKAMIEQRLMSGIICGQDSMDELIGGRGYGNQFASLQTVTVDYLDNNAARQLVEDPVRLPSDLPMPFERLAQVSRYSEGAVARILDLTASSPFYIQHLCYDIVNLLNDDRNMLVSEMTVKKAIERLLSKGDFSTYFENLTDFRAGVPNPRAKEIEGRILYSIALATRDRMACDIWKQIGEWPRAWQDEARASLNGLVRRGVVVAGQTGDLHKIRVGMFRIWLQENRIFGDHPAPLERM